MWYNLRMNENSQERIVNLGDVPIDQWRTDYIGDGYRSCCYSTDHGNGSIILFGYDRNNEPTTFICPWKVHVKYTVVYEPKSKELDIFGRHVETRYFNTASQRRKFVEGATGINIIECDKPEIEFLHAMFDKVALEPYFNKMPLRIFFYDIETEIGRTFEYPKTAGQRINAITIYDTKTEKFYIWSLSSEEVRITESPLDEYSPDRFQIFYFDDNESRMLQNFLNWWERNYPDVTCGYNSQAFDMPYIVRRLENVLGEDEAKRISPVGRYNIKENNLENERANKQAEILVDVAGIFDADFLILYRDKFKVKSPLDGGYSLNNVGEAEELGKKVEYEGSLKEFYETDWSRFVNYNIRDVELLYRLERKCKLIPLTRSITSSGLNNYGSIYSSISYLIGSLSQFSKTTMGRTMVSYKAKDDVKTSKYEGAFVFEPIPGIYRGGIATVDFNSLYPNTIRSINISPETNIGHLMDDWFGYTSDESPVMSDVKEFTMTLKNPRLLKKVVQLQLVKAAKERGIPLTDKEALSNLVKELGLVSSYGKKIRVTRKQVEDLVNSYCIITRNNDILVKHEVQRGVVSEWCGYFFNKRKATKKMMAALEDKIYNKEITDPEEIAKTKAEIQNLNDTQQSIKIMINSIYGCLGTQFSPIYDADLAQSITRQGKFCNRNASLFLKNLYISRYGESEKYIHTVSGDTDSCTYSTKIHIKPRKKDISSVSHMA